ncbi:MAG: DUF1616 domain-containing protein [Nitrososphaerota archaeon]|jgi:uncharacterized membrane protein|nr:DUF1616 domain-containing protein [Nitrososphaerota archaeon]
MENENNQIITLKLEKKQIKKIAAILTVLIVICCVIVTVGIIYAPKPSGYHEMYLLDAQNQAANYPQVVIINQNSTFNTQVVIVNNKSTPCNFQVQAKIVRDTFNFPIDAPTYKTYEFTLDSKQSWNNQIPISINEEGNYSVAFELYTKNEENYRFTDNFCVLHIEAITSP